MKRNSVSLRIEELLPELRSDTKTDISNSNAFLINASVSFVLFYSSLSFHPRAKCVLIARSEIMHQSLSKEAAGSLFFHPTSDS
jgi:hypothetical protein